MPVGKGEAIGHSPSRFPPVAIISEDKKASEPPRRVQVRSMLASAFGADAIRVELQGTAASADLLIPKKARTRPIYPR